MLVGLHAIAACTVGPDHQPPTAELPDAFAGTRYASIDGAAVAPDKLWESLAIAELNELLSRAQVQNTSIAAAVATLNETRALSGLQVYSLFPTTTINAETERNKQSRQDPFAFPGPSVTERFRAGFDAVWEIDLFGNLRRQSEQIRRLVEADTAALDAVRLSVSAEVAQAYFGWRGSAMRAAILRRNLANQADSVALLSASLDAGRGTALDVERARAVERSLAATLPLAEASVDTALQRLAVLTRWSRDELAALLGEVRSMPTLPRLVAVGSPNEWLARRPDIAAAERRLAAASSEVGVETAQLYPIVTLVGDFGWNGRSESALGDSAAERWRVAPGLSWRLPDFGRVRQRIQAAEAREQGALATFDETWLLALEETENAMINYRASTEREAALIEAVAASSAAAELARLRFDAGADTYLAVLDAERSQIEFEDQLILAKTDRATALAALFKALGGSFAVSR